MPRERLSKYRWPATSLSAADMAALYAVRESSRPRIPISDLIARAVRAQYGKAVLPIQQPETMTLSKAA
jgi:hypothetical protein